MDILLQLFGNTDTATSIYLIMLGLLLLCGLGLPLPEDITLMTAGYLCYKGYAKIEIVIFIGLLGVLSGDSFVYFMGHNLKEKIFRIPLMKRVLSPERLKKAQDLLQTHHSKFIFSCRFLPGLRTPVYFTCGTLSIPYKSFIFWDGMAALISVPAIVYLAYWGGHQIDVIIDYVRHVEYLLVVLAIGTILYFGIRFYKKHKKSK